MECVYVTMIDRVLRPIRFGEPFRVQVARGCQEPPWAVGHSDELPISPCLGQLSTWAELALNIRSPARLPPLGCLQVLRELVAGPYKKENLEKTDIGNPIAVTNVSSTPLTTPKQP